MLLILSPSKTQDFESPLPKLPCTLPELRNDSLLLVKELKKYSPARLESLMDISPKLASLNHERFQRFAPEFTEANARPALLAFRGDVYDGLQADSFSKADITFAQSHLRILSGLYGLLRPLDLIQPYRLEMKTKLKTPRRKDLYAFWGSRITDRLNDALAASGNDTLINLASEEYFKAVQPEKLKGTIITPVFKEHHKGKLQVIALFAKQARGMMANYCIKERIRKPDLLRSFNMNGYCFAPDLSDAATWVFARRQ